jgi:hypothetical protein
MIPGLLVLFIFVADVWAVTTILNSTAKLGTKVIWCLLVVLLPILGFIISFVAGPEDDSLVNGIKEINP